VFTFGLSNAGLSLEERAEAFSEVVDAVGRPRLGLLFAEADPKPHACVAAFEASGRDRSELGIFDAVLPSLPGLSVRNILPFFSGDGVRDFLSPDPAGASAEALAVLANSLSRIDPVPELLREAMAGRIGRGGGLPRSEYSIGGTEPPPSQFEGPSELLELNGTPCGGGMGAFGSGVGGLRLSLEPSRLFCNASKRSTLSLHCNSSWRNDSKRAFSVEEVGRYVEGLRRALW
jgi:hypothetical protein